MRYNTSLGVALPTPSRSVDPLHAISGFLCIDTSEICVHLLYPQLETSYWGKYRAPLCAVVHPIYTSGYDSYVINSRIPLYIAGRCVASCVLSSNALKSLIIASGCFPSRRCWGPLNSGFAGDWELRGAARSAPDGTTLQAATLFSQR